MLTSTNKLDAQSDASRFAQIEHTKILTERDSLLDTLNTVRSRLASTSPSFRASDPNFSTLCRRFFANLSGNFIPPWQAPNSRLIAWKVELEELRTANIEYAEDLRELQRQLLTVAPQMTDYFADKLPSNHAIRTITRAAASASLKSEPLVVWLQIKACLCSKDNAQRLHGCEVTDAKKIILSRCLRPSGPSCSNSAAC